MTVPNPIDRAPMLTAAAQQSLDAAMNAVHMQVTPENVLEVRNVLLAESDRLRDLVTRGGGDGQWVRLCGGDPVSLEASVAFNQRIGAMVQHCQQYAAQLMQAGRSLDQVAEGYGHTEDQIAASYRAFQSGSSA